MKQYTEPKNTGNKPFLVSFCSRDICMNMAIRSEIFNIYKDKKHSYMKKSASIKTHHNKNTII